MTAPCGNCQDDYGSPSNLKINLKYMLKQVCLHVCGSGSFSGVNSVTNFLRNSNMYTTGVMQWFVLFNMCIPAVTLCYNGW